MTDDLVERVGEAISEARTGNSLSWRHYIAEAQAAIAAINLPGQREAAARAALEAAERELAMTCLANSEAPSEWIDGFEHAGKRLRAIDPAAFRGDDHD